jgi:predicted anti-sigma-YlaC factor YlaD
VRTTSKGEAQFEGFIDDFLDGALNGRQKFVFETHLKLCRKCREYLQEYASSIYLAKQQAASPTSDVDLKNVPSDLINAILAAKSDSG